MKNMKCVYFPHEKTTKMSALSPTALTSAARFQSLLLFVTMQYLSVSLHGNRECTQAQLFHENKKKSDRCTKS